MPVAPAFYSELELLLHELEESGKPYIGSQDLRSRLTDLKLALASA